MPRRWRGSTQILCRLARDSHVPIIWQRTAVLVEVDHLDMRRKRVCIRLRCKDRSPFIRLVKHRDIEGIDMQFKEVRDLAPQEAPAISRNPIDAGLLRAIAVSHKV